MNSIIHGMTILELDHMPPSSGWGKLKDYLVLFYRITINALCAIGRLLFQRSEFQDYLDNQRAKCRYYGTF